MYIKNSPDGTLDVVLGRLLEVLDVDGEDAAFEIDNIANRLVRPIPALDRLG
jgi:hypothetical protein